MKYSIAIIFFLFAIIELSIWVSMRPYFRTTRPSHFWSGSLLVALFATLCFGLSTAVEDNINSSGPAFTSGALMLMASGMMQGLFFRSLTKPIGSALKSGFTAGFLAFSIAFIATKDGMGYFERTILLSSAFLVVLLWQLVEIHHACRQSTLHQLRSLRIIVILELAVVFSRLLAALQYDHSTLGIEQVPPILVFLILFQFCAHVISYVTMAGYWAEKSGLESAMTRTENARIKTLLAERQRLISDLIKANKSMVTGALSASIAHELSQPLFAMKTNARLIKLILGGKGTGADRQVPSAIPELVDGIIRDTGRSTEIIKSLRAIFSQDRLHTKRHELGDLVESALAIMAGELKEKRIEVSISSDGPVCVDVAGNEIIQVLVNLLSNAVGALSAIDGDRKLVIATRLVQPFVQISVTDNGLGVDSSLHGRLFELLDSGKESGMGLGLWLCRYIVERYSGSIRHELAPDGGAVFSFTLPLADSPCAEGVQT